MNVVSECVSICQSQSTYESKYLRVRIRHVSVCLDVAYLSKYVQVSILVYTGVCVTSLLVYV